MARRRGSAAWLVALVAVALVASACKKEGAPAPEPEEAVEVSVAASAKDLELSISLKKKYPAGAPIPLRMRLRNIGSEPLVVNRRFLVNDPKEPPEFREVTLRIRMPNGQMAEFAWDIRAGFPDAKDFRKLKPGRSVKSKADLAELFGLDAKGKYRVKAIYRNVHRGPTVQKGANLVTKNRKAAKVKIASPAIEFRIV